MLLELADLRIAFGDAAAVDGVSFNIENGQRIGLVGEAGSGKSLVGLAVAGLLPKAAAMSGKITQSGRVSIVRQDDQPSPDPLGKASALVKDRALLEALGVPADRFASELTVAQRQLLLIAMAIGHRPDLLILDEAFILLDAPTQKRLVDVLAAQTMGMLVIGHDFAAISALTSRVLILEKGKVVESGATTAIFSRPAQDYSKGLIAGGRIRARTLMRSPIGTELLEVNSVTVTYPDRQRIFHRKPTVTALDKVSFALRRGEALALVGADGSGKSTLARLIAGLGKAKQGTLAFERMVYRGRDLPRLLRKEISLVFADPRLAFNPELSLGASVTEPLQLDETHTIEEQSERLVEVLRAVRLAPEHLDVYPRDLSLYDLQCLALVRALIARPKLVVLDEPVRLLHNRQRVEMLMLINRLRADFGFSAIITASSLELVRHIADRALVLDAGRIVDEGTPGALLEAPKHPATQAMADARLPEVGIGVVAPVGR